MTFVSLARMQACAHIDHADVLAQMAPVDRETACLLMDNMAANFGNPAVLSAHLQAAAAEDMTPLPVRGAAHHGHMPAHVQNSRQHARMPGHVFLPGT